MEEKVNINGETYYRTEGAQTAPNGYAWFNNRKSFFGGERKSVLLPIDEGGVLIYPSSGIMPFNGTEH